MSWYSHAFSNLLDSFLVVSVEVVSSLLDGEPKRQAVFSWLGPIHVTLILQTNAPAHGEINVALRCWITLLCIVTQEGLIENKVTLLPVFVWATYMVAQYMIFGYEWCSRPCQEKPSLHHTCTQPHEGTLKINTWPITCMLFLNHTVMEP